MLRLITCQRTTLLLEQGSEQVLPSAERRGLWLHLRYCPYCRRYARQTALINELARRHSVAQAADEAVRLSPAARLRLAVRLREAGLGPDELPPS